jgi:hypothetical protein
VGRYLASANLVFSQLFFSLSRLIEYVKSGEIVRTDRGPCLFVHFCPAFGKREWLCSSLSAVVSHCILGFSENF